MDRRYTDPIKFLFSIKFGFKKVNEIYDNEFIFVRNIKAKYMLVVQNLTNYC